MGRYIDPRTDFGFKRLFGQEDSKEILKQFLFDVLKLPYPIVELTYIPLEQLPKSAAERRGIYDVYCVDSMGQRFIVEMQQADQENVKERALYYSTFAITHQAQRGADWQFNLLPVYCILILDFTLMVDDKIYLRYVQLCDTDNKSVFYNKLTFVYIELVKFKQLLENLSPAEKWIYLLRHMPELQQIPAELASEPFTQAFAIAEEAALSPEDRWVYEGSLKQARIFNAQLTAATEKGMAQGLEKGIEKGRLAEKVAIVRSLLQSGLERPLIVKATGLTEAALNDLAE